MRIMLVLLCSFSLSSCISSVVAIGCGASALSMPSNDPVSFTAKLNVETATGPTVDQLTYTCEVKERKCVAGNWKRTWIEQDIPTFNVQLDENYRASITAPTCRLSSQMAINDSNGYTEIITIFDSATGERLFQGTDRNTDLTKYGIKSLSVKVK